MFALGGCNVIFSDTFSGPLDHSKWRANWLGGTDGQVTPPVNGAERNCYDPAQVATDTANGVLWLTVTHRNCTASNGVTYTWAAGMVQTDPHFHFTYGLLTVRAYFSGGGTGQIRNWPAIWTDGQSWPTNGEIDVVEGLDGNACWHTHTPSGGPGGCTTADFTGWHTYAINWQPGDLRFLYDGQEMAHFSGNSVPSSPHYVILNYAVPSSGVVGDDTMMVDYVKVEQ